jgi:hypothetical protein
LELFGCSTWHLAIRPLIRGECGSAVQECGGAAAGRAHLNAALPFPDAFAAWFLRKGCRLKIMGLGAGEDGRVLDGGRDGGYTVYIPLVLSCIRASSC